MKNAHFSGKGRQSFHVYTLWEFLKINANYVKLDNMLYSINYGNNNLSLVTTLGWMPVLDTDMHSIKGANTKQAGQTQQIYQQGFD